MGFSEAENEAALEFVKERFVHIRGPSKEIPYSVLSVEVLCFIEEEGSFERWIDRFEEVFSNFSSVTIWIKSTGRHLLDRKADRTCFDAQRPPLTRVSVHSMYEYVSPSSDFTVVAFEPEQLEPETLISVIKLGYEQPDVSIWECGGNAKKEWFDPITLRTGKLELPIIILRSNLIARLSTQILQSQPASIRSSLCQQLSQLNLRAKFFPVPISKDSAHVVSVVIRTVTGRGSLLRQAIQSVLNQTYKNIEILIVQDGGSDQQEAVNDFETQLTKQSKIRFFRNERKGRAFAGNLGLSKATGKYLMFLDDDDLLFPCHVELLTNILETQGDAMAAYAPAIEALTRYRTGNDSYDEVIKLKPQALWVEWNYETLLDHNYLAIQGVLFRSDLFRERGGFDPRLEQLEDWNLWLRYGWRNRFVFLPVTTSMFRSPYDCADRLKRQERLTAWYSVAKKLAVEATNQLLVK